MDALLITTDLHVYGGLFTGLVELWIQKWVSDLSPSGGKANHQKPLWKINITIGLAVRTSLPQITSARLLCQT